MFERYTENALRVIFFARDETSEFGTPEIEAEHFLLSLLRQDKALLDRLAAAPLDVESIRQQIRDHRPASDKTPTDVDVPLSEECKRALEHTAEEAKQLNHKRIGTEHMLLGLLLVDGCFAAEILKGLGLSAEIVRENLVKRPIGG